MKPTVITGAARSGTSAVAGMVFHLGVDLGEYFLCHNTQNPLGYFEDARIVEIDTKYYESDRTKWYTEMREHIKSRIQKDPWGFKNPVLAVNLEEVKEIFKELHLSPKYIQVIRDIEKVKKSREIHHGEEKHTEKHIAYLTEHLKGENVLEIHYEDITSNPAPIAKQIIDFLELEPTPDQMLKAVLSITLPPPKGGEPILAVPSRLYR